jgi:hypothetical protein
MSSLEVSAMPTKPKQPQEFREGMAVHFRGSVAVKMRLHSAGMTATRVSMWRGELGSTWVAETDKGTRWVRHTEQGWQILKAPPVAEKVIA